jgi:hypothetical protein
MDASLAQNGHAKRRDAPTPAPSAQPQPETRMAKRARTSSISDERHVISDGRWRESVDADASAAQRAQAEQQIEAMLAEIKRHVILTGVALGRRQVKVLETLRAVLDRAKAHEDAIRREHANAPTTIDGFREELARLRREDSVQRELLDLFIAERQEIDTTVQAALDEDEAKRSVASAAHAKS